MGWVIVGCLAIVLNTFAAIGDGRLWVIAATAMFFNPLGGWMVGTSFNEWRSERDRWTWWT